MLYFKFRESELANFLFLHRQLQNLACQCLYLFAAFVRAKQLRSLIKAKRKNKRETQCTIRAIIEKTSNNEQ